MKEEKMENKGVQVGKPGGLKRSEKMKGKGSLERLAEAKGFEHLRDPNSRNIRVLVKSRF